MKRIKLLSREDAITYLRRTYRHDDTGCWLWVGGKTAAGYGLISYNKGQHVYAHRLSYELANGPIGAGLEICHLCDVPACVNPEHLFAATHSENLADARRKGRMRKSPLLRGKANPRSRLTDSQVLEIKKLRREGVPREQVARAFGVYPGTIWCIDIGRTWRHL